MFGLPVARGTDFMDDPGVLNAVDPLDLDVLDDDPAWSRNPPDDDDGADGVHGDAKLPPPTFPTDPYSTCSRPEQHRAPRHRRHLPAISNCIASDRSSVVKSSRLRNS